MHPPRWTPPLVALLPLLGLLSPILAIPDPNARYLLNDSLCARALNETRLTSPADCPLTGGQVWACLSDQARCVDEHLFRDIHLVLLAVIVGLLALRFPHALHKRPVQQDRNRKLRYVRGQR